MTSEPTGPTEKWVEDNGMEYAYCYDKGSKLMGKVGATGYPSAILVDAEGKIAFLGHPSGVTEGMVEKAVQGALKKPIWDWPKSAAKVKKSVLKKDYGKALSEAQKLGDPEGEILTAVKNIIAGKLQSLKDAEEAGNWLKVEGAGKTLVKSFSGLPEQDEVKAIVDRLKGDKDAQKILKAQKKVAKMFSDKIKRKQIAKFEKELKKIIADFPDTAAANDASDGLVQLKKLKKR